MQNFREEIARLLAAHVTLDSRQIIEDLETPPSSELGDFAFPCFKLARELKKSPVKIASEFAGKLSGSEYFDKIEARGPYLNFYCSRGLLAELTVSEILKKGDKYGSQDLYDGKTMVIDFSAPNIAKPFGVGHLRSTVIGNALYRIFTSVGYRCIGINHLGDWGTQFGKLIVAYREWGDEEKLKANPITYLYELYVRFHDAAKDKPEYDDQARAWFKRLEEGDTLARDYWQRFRELSLAEFKRIYAILNVNFDLYQGESFYNELLDETVSEIEDKGLTQISDGALIVNLEEQGMPPCLLRKQDGATLYATRDLCAAIYRQKEYSFDSMLYVVGADQVLHFQQVFAVLKKMEYEWADRCVHVPFGLIRFQDGKMSTRQGTLVFLEDVLNKSIELAKKIIHEKNPGLAKKNEVANQVGIGAVIFGDLSNDRLKDIEFDWDKVLDFSGETAPYVQYSHARICSILRKASARNEYNASLLLSDEEQSVVRALARFSEAIERAAELHKPSVVARYLVDLAQDFNKFYHQCPVLQADEDIRQARLALIDAVRQVLANGLYLLGIAAPEEM